MAGLADKCNAQLLFFFFFLASSHLGYCRCSWPSFGRADLLLKA